MDKKDLQITKFFKYRDYQWVKIKEESCYQKFIENFIILYIINTTDFLIDNSNDLLITF